MKQKSLSGQAESDLELRFVRDSSFMRALSSSASGEREKENKDELFTLCTSTSSTEEKYPILNDEKYI